MKNEHITDILNKRSFDSFSENDLAAINTHVVGCESCQVSFKAAQISAVLIKTRAAETIAPSPFFESKLMAAWREKQVKSAAAFWRWWQASNAVVAAMILTVAVLLLITLLTPKNALDQPEQALILNNYSTEDFIFNKSDSNVELTNGQTLQIIYEQQK